MPARYRPHVLGIDDGPFVKHVTEKALIVGVMMEGGTHWRAGRKRDLHGGVAGTALIGG